MNVAEVGQQCRFSVTVAELACGGEGLLCGGDGVLEVMALAQMDVRA